MKHNTEYTRCPQFAQTLSRPFVEIVNHTVKHWIILYETITELDQNTV